jgi:hypothetical protein
LSAKPVGFPAPHHCGCGKSVVRDVLLLQDSFIDTCYKAVFMPDIKASKFNEIRN